MTGNFEPRKKTTLPPLRGFFARGRVGVGAVILFQLAPMAQGHPVPTFPRALCAQGKGLDWRAFAARCNPSVVERREETLNPP